MPWALPHVHLRLWLRQRVNADAAAIDVCEQDATTVAVARTDEAVVMATHMEEAAAAAARADVTVEASIKAPQAYEIVQDLICVDKDISQKVPTMEKSYYEYFNHWSSSDEDE